ESAQERDCTVRLFEATEPVVTETKHVAKGESRFRFRHTLTGETEALLTAEVDGSEDPLSENNRASALVFITDRPRVLLVEGRPDSGRPLAEALKRQYIDVETRPPGAMPDRLAELEEYELLMLSNVPAAALTSGRTEAVRQYVRDFGGGLIVVGGDRSLTAGGYRDTVLEEVLPVRCDVRKDRPKPSLAMVLVIDRSASMEGESIELAKLATRQAVEKLAPSDQVGVIAFEDDSHWVSEGIQPCSERESVIEEIAKITAGGGTNLYPAMEKAYLALHEAFADRKHMIVLSDGLSHPGDFETLTREIAGCGITVSTVAMGEQAAEQLLQDIARRGKGHYYYCRGAAAVPSVFVLEATTAGKLGIIEELVSPQVAALGEVFRDVELGELPPLLGYVQTVARPNGQLALSMENNDPLLIWWKHGRGVSVAFTSSVQDSWAPLWLNWPGLGPFWAQLVRHAMRKEEPRGFALHLERRDNRARLTLDAVDDDDQYINGAEATLDMVDPDGKRHELPLPQVAPGRYAADFATPTPGPYRLEVTLSYGDGASYVGRRGLVVGYADEFRLGPTNKDLLRQIAETTGGRYNPRPAEVFAPPDDPGLAVRRTTPCWPYFLIAVAFIFLIDLALKRIDLATS
ncbi:MAG: vWA domain-containing protein, partial [Planctomycetota bacterium]